LGQGGGGESGNIGIGFAMPINKAKAMLEEYRTRGRIARPVLGLVTVFIEGDLAEELNLPRSGGLLVQQVESGSAAEEANIRGPRQSVVVGMYQLGVGGDLITEVEDRPVRSKSDLDNALARKRAGETLRLTILRNGRAVHVNVTLGEAPETL
jgi:S1-C subfamily serine protease